MVARRSNRKSGFTLVEILIVVIILGILAAIVIPQFTNASQDARTSSLVSQLQTLRSQIELYKLQHKDQLPNLIPATGWDLLLNKTDADQNMPPLAGATEFGPYLQAVPKNPLNGLSTLENGDGTGNASAAVGFIYDYNAGAGTGRIWGTAADGTTLYVE
jgi:general secretion pathway protein G